MRSHQLLSIEEVVRVLQACRRARDQLLVCLCFSDLAVEEVLRLRHGDIDIQNGTIRVVPRDEERIHRKRLHPQRKTVEPYAVPLAPRARLYYEQYLAKELPEEFSHPDRHVFASLWPGSYRGQPVRGRAISYEACKQIFVQLSTKTGIFVRPIILHRSWLALFTYQKGSFPMLDANLHKRYSAADLKQLLADLQAFDIHLQNENGVFLERYAKLVIATCGERWNPDLEQRLPDQGESLFKLFGSLLDLIEQLLVVQLNYHHGTAFIASKGKSFGVSIRPDIILSQEVMRQTIANLLEQIQEPNVVKATVLDRCSDLLHEGRSEKIGESYWQLASELEQIESAFDDHPWARCLSGLAHLCLPGGREAGIEKLFQALLRVRCCGDRLDRALLCSIVNSYCLL